MTKLALPKIQKSPGSPFAGRYMIEGVPTPSVTQILDKMGMRPGHSHIDPDVLAAAGGRGTRVHEAISRHLTGERDPHIFLQPSDLPFYDAYLKFRLRYGITEVYDVEKFVQYQGRYAGTLDAVVAIHSPRLKRSTITFLDWKTRDYVLGDGLQLAAYQAAYINTKYLEEGDECTFSTNQTERWIVSLSKSGEFKVTKCNDPLDWAIFVNCLKVFHWRLERGLIVEA